jgi:UDP-3-O-[3-hydroxymyristoyl] glucosamine N-acyltransferase
LSGPSLGELAVRFGCELHGDPDRRVESIGTLGAAGPRQLAFLANPRLRTLLGQTRAGAVVLDAGSAADCPTAALVAANPHATFARIAALLHPTRQLPAGVHPSAVVGPGVLIDPTAAVGPLAVVGSGTRLGPRSSIGAGCVVGADVVLGADVRLVARVTLGDGVVVGDRCIVQPGAVIGADGFGFAAEQRRWVKVPQVGTVLIAADVEVGANTTIDRGAIGDTVIEEGVKLDNQIQIGHNVRIGAHTAIAGCVGIAGSAIIGARCQLAGQVGVVGHVSICDDVVVLARSVVASDIREPGVYSNTITAEKASEWRKIAVRIRQLDRIARRLSAVEHALGRGGVAEPDAPVPEAQ